MGQPRADRYSRKLLVPNSSFGSTRLSYRGTTDSRELSFLRVSGSYRARSASYEGGTTFKVGGAGQLQHTMSEKAGKSKKSQSKKADESSASRTKKSSPSSRESKATTTKKDGEEQERTTEARGEESAEEATVTTTALSGPVPQARVTSRHELEMHERRAKGFSFGELSAASITFTIARGLGLPVDIRRRSTLEDNVTELKGWYKPAPRKAPTEPRPEKKAKSATKRAEKKAAKKGKKKPAAKKSKKEQEEE